MAKKKQEDVSDRTRAEELRIAGEEELAAREREDAEGVEVYSDPDALLPASVLVEGPNDEATFTRAIPDDEEEVREGDG